MRLFRTAACLIAVSSPTVAADAETVIGEQLKLFAQLTDALKSVKDQATAEAAAPRLRALDERGAAVKTGLAAVRQLPPADRERLLAQHEAALSEAGKKLSVELERIGKLPKLEEAVRAESAILKDLYATRGKLEEDAAKLRVRQIDTALKSFYLRSEAYPKALDELTRGDTPVLEADALVDPWGKKFRYDPAGPKNRGDKPDVWTEAPGGKVIGNWKDGGK